MLRVAKAPSGLQWLPDGASLLAECVPWVCLWQPPGPALRSWSWSWIAWLTWNPGPCLASCSLVQEELPRQLQDEDELRGLPGVGILWGPLWPWGLCAGIGEAAGVLPLLYITFEFSFLGPRAECGPRLELARLSAMPQWLRWPEVVACPGPLLKVTSCPGAQSLPVGEVQASGGIVGMAWCSRSVSLLWGTCVQSQPLLALCDQLASQKHLRSQQGGQEGPTYTAARGCGLRGTARSLQCASPCVSPLGGLLVREQ